MTEISEKHYLGSLCRRNHPSEQDPSKSVRFKSSKGCIQCAYIQQQPDYERVKRPAGKTPEEKLANRRATRVVWAAANLERIKAYGRDPKHKAKAKEYRVKHRRRRNMPIDRAERERATARAWHARNKDRVNAAIRHRFATDPAFQEKRRQWKQDSMSRRTAEQRLRKSLQSRFWVAIRMQVGRGHAIKVHDYGVNWHDVVQHLGPCPGKRENWHVDHVIPLSRFDLTDARQVRLAFAPENHQWLPAAENLKKSQKDKEVSIRAASKVV